MSVDTMRSAMDLMDKIVCTIADAEDLMRSGTRCYEDRTIERVHDAALNIGMACVYMRRELAAVETHLKRRMTESVPANNGLERTRTRRGSEVRSEPSLGSGSGAAT